MAKATRTGTKYTEFADRIRTRIASGALEPGERLPSFQSARQRYGLSQSSVERAYTVLEEEGLIERRPYSGFYVAPPRQRELNGVIAIAEDFPFGHDYYLRLLKGVRDAAHARHIEVLLLHMGSRVSWDRVDGVLSCHPFCYELVHSLPEGMPHVSLLHRTEGAPCVEADDYHGIREAIEHLVANGHRSIAYLTPSHSGSPESIHRQRLAGYCDALAAADIEARPEWLYPGTAAGPVLDSKEYGYRNMRKWLRGDWKALGCTALLVQNDGIAMGALDALQEAKIKVPDDISVIGFDGLELSHPWCGRLTSVRVPLYKIGRRGTDLLIDWIQQRAPHKSTTGKLISLPTSLQMGDSVAQAKS